MKPSRYNFFYKDEHDPNKIILYNSRTSALSMLDREHYIKLKNFTEKNEAILDEEFTAKLQNSGYIINNDINELDLIRLNMLRGRFSSGNLSLVIAPTMNCNFRCVYCFEQNNFKNVFMSDDVIEGIVKMIQDRIKRLENLRITWYGGEPLLAFNVIQKLSEKMINLCTENDISYEADIVTNGYNLNKEIAINFKKLKITSMQITLDGPEDVHNKRRLLINGEGTFKKIITNISECISELDETRINIRINTDNENINRVDEVIDELKKCNLDKKVNTYLGLVEPANGNYDENKCLSVYEFSIKNVKFQKNYNSNLMSLYPKPVNNFCGADNDTIFIIDPEGYLYKCWNDIGIKEKNVGNILTQDNKDDNTNTNLLLNYMLYDPTSDDYCKECSVLPICMGGCPSKRLSESERCCQHKYILEEYLHECVDTITQNRVVNEN